MRNSTLASLLWVIATLLEATILSAQEGVVFFYAVVSSGLKYGLLGLLVLPVSRVTLRLMSASWPVFVGTHLVMGSIVILAWQAGFYTFLYFQLGSLMLLRLEETAWWQGLNAILTYTVLVAGLGAVQASHRLAAERARRSELALLARDAELGSLKAQLRPHFLFNTLNSIYSLIDSRPAEAQEMLVLLAELLRKTLESGDDTIVTVRSELEMIETYLRIEQCRLGDRLQVRIESSPDAAHLLVPPLILQPIVENAIKHGIAPEPAGGAVHVHARKTGQALELLVRDTGHGIARRHTTEGRGLDITRRRLKALYGEAASLSLRNGGSQGFEVRMRVPVGDVTTLREPHRG